VADREWLREARNFVGWSRQELGKRCGLSAGAIGDFEVNGSDCRQSTVHKMFRALEHAGAFQEEAEIEG